MTTIVACHSHQGAAPSRPASDRHPRYRSPHCSGGCPGSRTGCSSAAACGRQCGHERQETSVAHRNGLVRRNLLDALRVGTSPRNRAVSSVARGERGRASHLHGESGNAAFGQRLGRVSRVKTKRTCLTRLTQTLNFNVDDLVDSADRDAVSTRHRPQRNRFSGNDHGHVPHPRPPGPTTPGAHLSRNEPPPAPPPNPRDA